MSIESEEEVAEEITLSNILNFDCTQSAVNITYCTFKLEYVWMSVGHGLARVRCQNENEAVSVQSIEHISLTALFSCQKLNMVLP